MPFRKWLWRIVASATILLTLALAAAVFDNNVSIRPPSRAEFVADLDESLARSTDWVLAQYRSTASGGVPTPEGRALVTNSALAHMVVDCASLSTDSRMKAVGSRFVDAWKVETSPWAREVVPTIAARAPNQKELESIEEYQRWILYGVAPDNVPLSPNELADMFSPDKYRTGKATHQLFALYLYRKSKGSTPQTDRVMQTIEERVASEAALDFRVTDLYLQRIAFLLAAGRPDLVKRRWIERALAAQQSDGGWLATWHGWDRTPYRFSIREEHSIAHSTAQAMWMAHMLKYRYPEWIDRNYK